MYAEALGIDNARLLVAQPESGEMALEIVDQLVRRYGGGRGSVGEGGGGGG